MKLCYIVASSRVATHIWIRVEAGLPEFGDPLLHGLQLCARGHVVLRVKEKQVGVVDRDGGVLLVELQGPLVRRPGVVYVLQMSQGDCKIMKKLDLDHQM